MGQVHACDRCVQGFKPEDKKNILEIVVNDSKPVKMELCDACLKVVAGALVMRKRGVKVVATS
jgi:hypothetical protein